MNYTKLYEIDATHNLNFSKKLNLQTRNVAFESENLVIEIIKIKTYFY